MARHSKTPSIQTGKRIFARTLLPFSVFPCDAGAATEFGCRFQCSQLETLVTDGKPTIEFDHPSKHDGI